ncbi:MAG: hypothetical protein ABI304_06380 [Rudaea sp.]
MKIIHLSAIMLATLFSVGAGAQPMPPHPGSRGLPSMEALATVPSLSVAQQIELRKILIQRRDAQQAARAKTRAEFDALRVKGRNERERIDDQTSEQLRKLLGDDGYRHYAEWDLDHHGRRGGVDPHPSMRPRGGGRHGPDNRAMPPPSPNAAGDHGTSAGHPAD